MDTGLEPPGFSPGEIQAWLSTDPKKDRSLRKLAGRQKSLKGCQVRFAPALAIRLDRFQTAQDGANPPVQADSAGAPRGKALGANAPVPETRLNHRGVLCPNSESRFPAHPPREEGPASCRCQGTAQGGRQPLSRDRFEKGSVQMSFVNDLEPLGQRHHLGQVGL